MDSDRLNFKDPDVVFVANLGTRGLSLNENQFWVRYKAKNSYGAYLQGNMLCGRNEANQYVRLKSDEYLQWMDVKIALWTNIQKGLYSDDREITEGYKRNGEEFVDKMAKEIVFTSPDDLSMYKHDEGTKK